jgi:hypothetical protein
VRNRLVMFCCSSVKSAINSSLKMRWLPCAEICERDPETVTGIIRFCTLTEVFT